jgi:hypothetical protein
MFAQNEQEQQWRAFPITDYFVDLDDSTRVVQVMLPEGISFTEKQLAVLRGVYRTSHADTALKGFGRCQLIKGDYYYFAISANKSGIPAKEGDLLYTYMTKATVYEGLLTQPAAHFITLQDVYDQPFYDPYSVFSAWTASMEENVLDTMVKDIRFTGKYFLENDPAMDLLIESGPYKGRKLLQVMIGCQVKELTAFLGYMAARPLLYAGRSWKLSEVFATWLSAGSPTVIKK